MTKPLPAPTGATCQDASPLSTTHYIPCGKPGAYVIQHSRANEPPYVMCAMCADRNVKNRGARLIRRGEKHAPIAVIEAAARKINGKSFRIDARKPSPSDALARMTAMAEVLKLAQNKAAIKADELAAAQAEITQIEGEDLPQLMEELGLKNFRLEDGSGIDLIEDVKCGITEANRPAAHSWVRKGGWGAIIDVVLTQKYGKGEEEMAAGMAKRLREISDHEVDLKEGIHYSRLKSFINERRAAGTNIPADLFGLHVFSKVKLTPPKEKKVKASK